MADIRTPAEKKLDQLTTVDERATALADQKINAYYACTQNAGWLKSTFTGACSKESAEMVDAAKASTKASKEHLGALEGLYKENGDRAKQLNNSLDKLIYKIAPGNPI